MRRSAEDVCIEYAMAVAGVRLQTTVMANNRCPHEVPEERHSEGTIGGISSCLTALWNENVRDRYGEFPAEDLAAMCSACQIRYFAFTERQVARKRAGAAKRAVEAVGKRLLKLATPVASSAEGSDKP